MKLKKSCAKLLWEIKEHLDTSTRQNSVNTTLKLNLEANIHFMACIGITMELIVSEHMNAQMAM